jgi:hypothetical protein
LSPVNKKVAIEVLFAATQAFAVRIGPRKCALVVLRASPSCAITTVVIVSNKIDWFILSVPLFTTTWRHRRRCCWRHFTAIINSLIFVELPTKRCGTLTFFVLKPFVESPFIDQSGLQFLELIEIKCLCTSRTDVDIVVDALGTNQAAARNNEKRL